tara:strand:- start:216 stop:335 length:120 start_codon:yes stop_codon:yes gene_type:complete
MARNVKKTETGCIFGNLYGIVIIDGKGMFNFSKYKWRLL